MDQTNIEEQPPQPPSAKTYANFGTYYISFQVISFLIISISFVFLYFVGMYIYFLIFTILGDNPIIVFINQVLPWTKNIENLFLLESGGYEEFSSQNSVWIIVLSVLTGAFFSYFKIKINLKKIVIGIAVLMLPFAFYAYIVNGSQIGILMYYFISLGMLFIYMRLMKLVDTIEKVLEVHRRIGPKLYEKQF